MARTVGDLLASARRQAVWGRESELAALLDLADDPARVLAHVHGPGGVGKSTLLDVFAEALTSARPDRPLVCLDGADLEPSPAGLTEAVTGLTGGAPADLLPESVLVVDRFELLEPVAQWFWQGLVPALPAGVHVVVASRREAPESWRADPAYAACTLTLSLRNLDPAAAGALLRARDVPEGLVDGLVEETRGHPLALAIASETGAAAGGSGGALFDHPDAAARLLGRFLEESVDPLQRRALHVCGHARRVDRALLAAALDVDDETADELLAWLRARPYAESHPDGLSLHDLVADALEHDLRWRDAQAHAQLHSAVRAALLRRLERAGEVDHHRLAGEIVYLHRFNPVARALFAVPGEGEVRVRPLRDDDAERDWLRRAFDTELRGDTVDWWSRRQPASVVVFEADDAPQRRLGAFLSARIDLERAGLAAHDPVVAWALEQVSEQRPPEPAEVVFSHVSVDAVHPGSPDRVSFASAAASVHAWRARGLGWVLVSSAHEDTWAPVWSYIGFERVGSVSVGGGSVGVWARDFGRSPFLQWLEAMAAREIDDGSMSPPVASPVALSRVDFGDAVRRALKVLHDPVALRASPLLSSRLLAHADDAAAVLLGTVRTAVETLRADPRSALAASAPDRTYLRPAGSQERAAEVVGTSFSTYRRHLAAGTDRLEALLWEWELHGPPSQVSSE